MARMAMLSFIPPLAAVAIACSSGAVPSGRTASLAAIMTVSIGWGRAATCPGGLLPSVPLGACLPLFG
eukprot:9223941-Lingulodinium_polyedra.AAC.1